MREIKFRAKAISGEWVYGNFIHSKRFEGCSNEFRIHNQETGLESDIIDNTISQFTGLYDKNGVEIYDGDAYREEIETDLGDFRHYFICTWIKEVGMFSFLAEHELIDYQTLGDKTELIENLNPICKEDLSRIKIVKNIYTSPELLK